MISKAAFKAAALAGLAAAALLFPPAGFAEGPCGASAPGAYHTNPDGARGGFVARTAFAAPHSSYRAKRPCLRRGPRLWGGKALWLCVGAWPGGGV